MAPKALATRPLSRHGTRVPHSRVTTPLANPPSSPPPPPYCYPSSGRAKEKAARGGATLQAGISLEASPPRTPLAWGGMAPPGLAEGAPPPPLREPPWAYPDVEFWSEGFFA